MARGPPWETLEAQTMPRRRGGETGTTAQMAEMPPHPAKILETPGMEALLTIQGMTLRRRGEESDTIAQTRMHPHPVETLEPLEADAVMIPGTRETRPLLGASVPGAVAVAMITVQLRLVRLMMMHRRREGERVVATTTRRKKSTAAAEVDASQTKNEGGVMAAGRAERPTMTSPLQGEEEEGGGTKAADVALIAAAPAAAVDTIAQKTETGAMRPLRGGSGEQGMAAATMMVPPRGGSVTPRFPEGGETAVGTTATPRRPGEGSAILVEKRKGGKVAGDDGTSPPEFGMEAVAVVTKETLLKVAKMEIE